MFNILLYKKVKTKQIVYAENNDNKLVKIPTNSFGEIKFIGLNEEYNLSYYVIQFNIDHMNCWATLNLNSFDLLEDDLK